MSRTRQTARTTPEPLALAAEIEGLTELDLHDLRVRWRKLTRKEAPEHLGRALLIRIIAYRMQARIHGDLDADSVRQLEQIAGEHERRRRAGTVKPKAVPLVAPAPRDRGQRPGTLFIREYAGEMHRVCVTGDGFEWQGAVYRSLSEIARLITGTSWSGPRFFGLRDNTEPTSGVDNAKADGRATKRRWARRLRDPQHSRILSRRLSRLRLGRYGPSDDGGHAPCLCRPQFRDR